MRVSWIVTSWFGNVRARRTVKNSILETLLLSLVVSLFLPCSAYGAERETPLDVYVQKPDSHYHYTLAGQSRLDHATVFHIHMVSQMWRTPDEVLQPEWVHWLEVYVPDKVVGSTGLLFISGGVVRNTPPETNTVLEEIAVETNSVVAELRDVPNEPLTFVGDPHGKRTEDQIIAYTWRKYIQTGDATWPLRLPMTKAAVRAMDTVTSFMASPDGGKRTVDRFVLAGASKRGWTVWTTAAVDRRVCAIVPMVIDVLNVIPSFEHHYRSYGFWSQAVESYKQEGLMDELHSTAYRNLMAIEDPYSYRARFTMPKLLIMASGDQFFLPDSSQFYFDKLPGEKHLLYEPNTDHSLRASTAQEDLEAFYLSVLRGTPRPQLTSHLEGGMKLHVHIDGRPIKVTFWQAKNPAHRDFRLESIGAAYHATELKPSEAGNYNLSVDVPQQGWTAFYVESDFPGDGDKPLRFTTQVYVLPKKEPYRFPKHGETLLESQASSAEGHR